MRKASLLFVTLVGWFVASTAFARAPDTFEEAYHEPQIVDSPMWWAAELKLGPYRPDNNQQQKSFGNDRGWLLGLEVVRDQDVGAVEAEVDEVGFLADAGAVLGGFDVDGEMDVGALAQAVDQCDHLDRDERDRHDQIDPVRNLLVEERGQRHGHQLSQWGPWRWRQVRLRTSGRSSSRPS